MVFKHWSVHTYYIKIYQMYQLVGRNLHQQLPWIFSSLRFCLRSSETSSNSVHHCFCIFLDVSRILPCRVGCWIWMCMKKRTQKLRRFFCEVWDAVWEFQFKFRGNNSKRPYTFPAMLDLINLGKFHHPCWCFINPASQLTSGSLSRVLNFFSKVFHTSQKGWL